ncbi:divalent-cation tolerance protein CutA [Thalassotalea ponticola]|uniref:divalent-cation tolerance protein CutA n=1 Tax=Thalassotalea ponticola TaxID=1523392 RepID=UPI0025B4E04E|nr:divalent-cation tolerance protein CutA [Thalassotalea ponticola]MDN3653701.1 divalent-cation tolerance protein CutA [Thalassotalea ponticola]
MYQTVLCNCPSKDIAVDIAKRLVRDKLAACVNVIDNVSSIYQWQGDVVEDIEVTLIIKTKASVFDQLATTIESMHPYDVAEIIAFDINQGSQQYLAWINETVK